MPNLSRRSFLIATTAPLVAAAACGSVTEPPTAGPARLRLHARPRSRGTVTGTDVIVGAGGQRTYIRVPPQYTPDTAAPLVIAFHGAGGRGDTMAAGFGSRTDARGAILLAPNSVFGTWDGISGSFEIDVPILNAALDETFDRCNIDASRIALLGFSDGATYAISLGLSNGDQLAGITAFSPGFFVEDHPVGTPDFFVSHGVNDAVLPIDQASRKIVPQLQAHGSNVTYVEFDGGHNIPIDIANQAMAWLDERF